MLPSAVKQQIFQSLPKSVIVGSTEYQAWVDYADRINISEKLRDSNIVVTLRYFADRRDDRHSPANQLFRKVTEQDIIYTKGERAQITLSINVHTRGDVNVPPAEILDAYMDQILLWYLRELPEISGLEVVSRSDVSDLTYLGDGKTPRRQLDVFIRYKVEYEEVIPTIETVEHTTEVH